MHVPSSPSVTQQSMKSSCNISASTTQLRPVEVLPSTCPQHSVVVSASTSLVSVSLHWHPSAFTPYITDIRIMTWKITEIFMILWEVWVKWWYKKKNSWKFYLTMGTRIYKDDLWLCDGASLLYPFFYTIYICFRDANSTSDKNPYIHVIKAAVSYCNFFRITI